MIRSRLVSSIVAVIVTLQTSVVTNARAAGSSTDAILAENLFHEAQRLMQEGRIEQACPKFAESQRLDPAGGTLLNLAACYEAIEKTASAWLTYNEALAVARKDGRTDREEYARQHLAALTPRLSRLELQVPADDRPPGLVISVDGQRVREAAWGVPMPLDPGQHEIVAEAPGHETTRQTVVLHLDGQQANVRIELQPAPVSEVPAPDVAFSGSTNALTVDASDERASVGTQEALGFAAAAVGLVAVGLGTYFGIRANSKWNERNDLCKPECGSEAAAAGDAASRAADWSTVSFVIGGVGLVGGGILIWTATASDSDQPSTEVSVGVGRGGTLLGEVTW